MFRTLPTVCFALAALLAIPVKAVATEVDLELVLLVDVSHSMTERELEIQRQGYAAALQSEEVFEAVQTGPLQRIALTYVEWAGTQEIIVDWTLIQTRTDLQAFAHILTTRFDLSIRRTSISEALVFAAQTLERNAFEGLRRVIDVSGDGPNNKGRPVLLAREAVLDKSIIINGLPIMAQDEFVSWWDIEDLDLYYEACVTGGPGSFVIPVSDWQDFEEAVRRKLVLEIASAPSVATVVQAQYSPGPAYDCMIGEKMWNRYQDYFSEP